MLHTNKYIHPIPFAKLASHVSSHDWVHAFFLLFFRLFPAHMSKSSSLIPHCFCCCSIDWCCTLMPLGLLNFWMDGWLFQTQFGISHQGNLWLHHSRSSPHCLWLLHLWNTPSFQPVTEVQLPHPQLEHLRLFSQTLATEGLIPNSFTSFISFHVFCCSSGLCFRCKSTKTKADPQRIHFIHAFRWMSKDKLACVLGSTEDNCERQKPHFHLNWFLAA